jgi:DedD protein
MGLFSKLSKNKQEAAGQDSGYYTSAADTAALERAKSKRASAADRNGDGARRTRAQDAAADPVLPEKKRARRRLVGAIFLALTVAVGLPMLLDSEPKPLASDIAIQIPSKDKPAAAAPVAAAQPSRVDAADALDKSEEIVKDVPIAKPAKPATPVAHAATPATLPAAAPVAAPQVAELKLHADPAKPKDSVKESLKESLKESSRAADAKLEAEAKAKARAEEIRHAKAEADAKAEAKAKADAKAKAEQEAKKLAEAKHTEAKPKTEDAARAMAILEDKPSDTKYLVQVAAVATQEKVDELQGKLKEAGIKSFTQKVTTASGALTRIRVGPFPNKEEAEKVRAKLSKIGLSSSLATS